MSQDHRSVGELLVANDLIARSILMDTDHLSARELTRSWPLVSAAADQFWSALPHAAHAASHVGREADRTPDAGLDRNVLSVIRPSDSVNGWPSAGPGDQRLVDMAVNFERAAELLRRYDRLEGVGLAPAVIDDLEAAKTRALHCLYVASHGVTVALRHEQDVLAEPAVRRGSPNPDGMVATVKGLQERFAAAEQSLSLHLGRRWPGSLEGEHREQPVQQRLRESMASWDVQARRAMSSPTAATAYVVCHAQAVVIGNGHALLRAAALQEHLDPHEYRDRLAPALETVTGRLRAAGEVWRNMARPSDEIDPGLRAAAREVTTAVGELVRDGAVPASLTTLQERVDLREVPPLMHRALITASETAYGIQDVARSTELAGPARWVNEAAAAAQARLYAANVEPSPMKAWVSPNALRRNDFVPLPSVLKDDLAGQMGHVVSAAASVREAAANVLERGPQLGGRAMQDKTPPQMGAPSSPLAAR